MAHIVKCRVCKQPFDIDSLDPAEWVKQLQLCYYHKKCYEDWCSCKDNAKTTNKDADFWYESLVDYLYRDIKMNIDFVKLKTQWASFIKPGKNMTPKGIYFAIRYYYDIMKGDSTKALGGIGIVNSIYNDAKLYWAEREIKKEGTIASIINQIQERNEREVKIINPHAVKKNKTRWNLDEI